MSYLTLLRGPHVLRLLVGTLVGRLPTAMAAVAIPLTLRDVDESYTFVGVAAAAFSLAAAAGGPLLGRLVDHLGQPAVLVPAVVLMDAGLVLVGAAPGNRAAVLVGALVAGAATPPLEPCLRVLWPDIVPPTRLESAYALDSASQELVFIGGPLVVAGCVAAVSPASALWVGALLGAAGVLLVVTATPARRWRAPARVADWLGPLRSRGLLVLLAGLTGVGVALGTLNVLVVSYAERHAVPGGAATLLAVNAAGALTGGLVYGSVRRWRGGPKRRVLALMAGLAAGYGLLCLVPSPVPMAGLMVLTGLFLAPVLTVSFVLVGDLAPRGTATEAFAWLVTLVTSGTAAGSALVGVVLERAPLNAAAAVGAVGVAAGLLVLWTGRALLAPTRAEPAPSPVGTTT